MTFIEKWFETRAHLSHDILKNRVMMAFRSSTDGSRGGVLLVPYLELFIARERDFRALIEDAPKVLQPGFWFADWMGVWLDDESASVVSKFLNMDFERTSSLPVKCQEIADLLKQALTAASQVIRSQSNATNGDSSEIESLIHKLSDELATLPSTMLEVVETMR